jgi:anti-sigma28 factor (negative regulator of flagellin synthesis)
MPAFRKPSSLAHQPPGTSDLSRPERPSPEHSATATSGTYFRAVRPSYSAEASALPDAEGAIDSAKIEGLRFELEVGVWRADSERIARLIIADAECGLDDAEPAVEVE